ncbi:hypothetical protein AKO1_013748 [Acrasis kona]|uniref:Aquaporin n=1 Tax=Acrasis kona TaxID=1008807 RepID=A0AAW2ZKL5_9EUKA
MDEIIKPSPGHIVVDIPAEKQDDKKDNKGKKAERKRPDILWWCRRIIVGKNVEEEKESCKKHPHFEAIKREFRRYVCEFIGTLFLILFVSGIQTVQAFSTGLGTNDVTLIDKGVISGFLLAGMIYIFGTVSGAHFNPLVTVAFFLRGVMVWWRTITYVIVQLAGAIVGAAILYGIFGNIGGLGTTVPIVSPGAALGVEILITFLLIMVVLSTAEKSKILGPVSAIAVGATFGSVELFAWNLTGASANPWRTFAPTIISGVGWRTIWVYFAGPIIGMIIAVIVQRIITTARSQDKVQDSAEGKAKNTA